jgi:CRISPR-associated protein Cas1
LKRPTRFYVVEFLQEATLQTVISAISGIFAMKRINDILILDDYGTVVRRKRMRLLIINSKKGIKEEVPVKAVRELVVLTKTSLSTNVIKLLVENGAGITICSYFGKPVARITGTRLGGSSINRKLQYKASISKEGFLLIKEILKAKIDGQRINLRYYAKSKRSTEVSDVFLSANRKLSELIGELEILDADNIGEAREQLLNIEARAASTYWGAIAKIYGTGFGFFGRDRTSQDIVNVSLNIAYHLVSIWIWKYLVYFSLDPYEGLLHVERPGRLSFVYDIMEPLRPIADRLTLGYILKNKPNKDFESIRRFKLYMLEQIAEYKVYLGTRKMSLKTAAFYYVQSIVSFLRNRGDLRIPKIYW